MTAIEKVKLCLQLTKIFGPGQNILYYFQFRAEGFAQESYFICKISHYVNVFYWNMYLNPHYSHTHPLHVT